MSPSSRRRALHIASIACFVMAPINALSAVFLFAHGLLAIGAFNVTASAAAVGAGLFARYVRSELADVP